MNGPEHYAEAERLLLLAAGSPDPAGAGGRLVAQAQVHATLAQAAATVDADENARYYWGAQTTATGSS